MVGDAAWDRLPESARQERRADGPALVADLLAMRGDAPFDVTALAVPAVFGRGGTASAAHHRDTVAWLASHVPGAELFEIEGAAHGAHLTHPDRFADLVRAAVALGALDRRAAAP
jgi:pimeloyl-ACP methyl ester carboxylesterase